MTRVLIVDGDASRRGFLRRLLQAGAEVVLEAEDAVAAVRLVQEEPPDLILNVLSVPQGDDLALLRQLQLDPAMAKSEAMLAESQAMAHIGSWDFDLATDTVAWSDEQYRLFGMQPRECPISYDVFLSKVHPADRDEVNANIQRNLRERRSPAL